MGSKQAFVAWMRQNDPFLYNIAVKRAAIANGQTMGDIMDLFTALTDTVEKIAPKVMELGAQKKILDVQLARAKNGLQPLQTTYSPTVGVGVVNTPQYQQLANQIAYSQPSQLQSITPILFGIGGLALAYMFIKEHH